jgi:tetratricopeptide (TPR) repeat protein
MSENNLKQAYQLVRKNPDDPQVWRNLGKLLQATGDQEKAAQCFQHARQLAATQTPSPPTQPSDKIGSPAGEGSAGRLRSGLGKAIQQGKTTVKRAAQAAQDADLANKAGRAAEGVTSAASQVSRFATEHQDTARQIGKTALDTTTQVGQTATKIGQATATTAATAKIVMIVVGIAAGLCALSAVATVIILLVK